MRGYNKDMDDQWVKDRALEFLQTYNPQGLVPFPFENTVNELKDVELLLLEAMEENISGAILFQDGEFKILINAKKPKARRYFTIAHEFGHYFLHSTWLKEHQDEGFIDFVSLLDGESTLFRSDLLPTNEVALRREREANNFAAEILMPESKVRELWDVLTDIEGCAEVFQVAKITMAIRLERLGLIS